MEKQRVKTTLNQQINYIYYQLKKYGEKLTQLLRQDYHLEPEMHTERYVILMSSLADTIEDFRRMVHALIDIDQRWKRWITEEKTERNAGYLVVSHSGGGMLRQGTRKGIRRTPANRGMRAHWVVKGLDISEDVCHGMCP